MRFLALLTRKKEEKQGCKKEKHRKTVLRYDRFYCIPPEAVYWQARRCCLQSVLKVQLALIISRAPNKYGNLLRPTRLPTG